MFIGKTNEKRVGAACAVFEGGVVVSGGNSASVEKYDHVADAWSHMPSMTVQRCGHKLVSTGSKLFAIGGDERSDCEVFDPTCNRFVALLSDNLFFDEQYFNAALSIGEKLLILENRSAYVLSYDAETDECLSKHFELTQ